MKQKDYELEVQILKNNIDSLTRKLWRNNQVKENFYSKEWVADAILDDIFTFEKENITKIQLEK